MPRKITLSSIDLNYYGAIGMQFEQQIVDGDITVPQTNVRRMVMPDQDIDANCDDLDAYFTQIGYPTIMAHDRTLIHAVRAAAEANPDMMAAKQKWIEQQAANAPPVAEPVP